MYCTGIPIHCVVSSTSGGWALPTWQLQPAVVQAAQAGVWQCEISLSFCQSPAPTQPSVQTDRVLRSPTTPFTPHAQDKDDDSLPGSCEEKNDSTAETS